MNFQATERTRAVNVLTNGSFETPFSSYAGFGSDGQIPFYYQPGGAEFGWTFDFGGTGVAIPFSGYALPAYDGNRFGFLQRETGALSQTFSVSLASNFTLSFALALRPFYDVGQVVQISLDGNIVNTLPTTATTWTLETIGLGVIQPGNHTITFRGLSGSSGETTAFIDDVKIFSGDAISIGDARIVEADAGTTNAVFNVTLSNPSDERVTVRYSTANGSATSSDFTSKSGTLTFNPRQTRQTIVIPIKGDTAFERDETFSVRLSNANNALITDGTATGTIVNDDLPLPTISIGDVSLFEGSSGTKTARFTVTLTGRAENPVSVLYNTANGSARAGSDFTPKAGSLNFRASNQSRQTQTISIPVKGDRIFEGNETFTVNLSSATNAEIRDSRGTGTIRNDDDRVVRSSVDFGDSINLLDEAAAYINQYLGSSTFKLPELQQPFTLTSGLINLDAFMG